MRGSVQGSGHSQTTQGQGVQGADPHGVQALLHPAEWRLDWLHSLRFRLAAMYTLLAFALVALVGLSMTVQLLRDLEGQFQTRLDERVQGLADAQNNPAAGLGRSLAVPSGSYAMLVDAGGTVIYATPGLQDYQNAPFPFRGLSEVNIGESMVRGATRPLTRGGFVWVGLSEDALVGARQSATRILLLAMTLTPALVLLLAWLAGQRALRGLGQAAALAERIDPSISLAALPLPRRQDEVYGLLSAINLLLERIEAQQSREKQLLGQIVHELGAPLTVLRASLERSAALESDPDVRRAALVADELSFTTQDLMQLARGQLELRLAWHLIPARSLRERLDRLVTGVRFLGNWDALILCDPDRLTQALRNLLANARRHAGPQGSVEVQLSERLGQVIFTVQDDGPGLPPELGERIFAPFVSGAGSSGLGLSVARQIARLHGGELTGGNRPPLTAGGPPGGAWFSLTLPGAALDGGDDDLDGELDDLGGSELAALLDDGGPALPARGAEPGTPTRRRP